MTTTKPILITIAVGNNPARCRMLLYHKGIEHLVDMKTPADYGGLNAPEFRKINPQGKIPALILPSGDTLFEAKVILQYLNDAYGDQGSRVGVSTPEGRARAALLVQVHDLYIASPNSSDPSVFANQGAMYKPVEMIDAKARASKVAELHKQLDVLESLIVGPYAAGEELSEADFTLWPTLSAFFAHMMPRVFGWVNPMDDDTRPKLRQWHAHVSQLPAAQRVRDEIMAGIEECWEATGRLEAIVAQVKAEPQLNWNPACVRE